MQSTTLEHRSRQRAADSSQAYGAQSWGAPELSRSTRPNSQSAPVAVHQPAGGSGTPPRSHCRQHSGRHRPRHGRYDFRNSPEPEKRNCRCRRRLRGPVGTRKNKLRLHTTSQLGGRHRPQRPCRRKSSHTSPCLHTRCVPCGAGPGRCDIHRWSLVRHMPRTFQRTVYRNTPHLDIGRWNRCSPPCTAYRLDLPFQRTTYRQSYSRQHDCNPRRPGAHADRVVDHCRPGPWRHAGL